MAKHQDLDAEKAHVPGFFQDTDPGAIGPGKLWIDTSGGTGNWEMKLRNATDDGWEAISGGSGFTDHGVLLGLGDDDHPQYHNDARGDARYTLIGHSHVENDITDLQDYLTEAAADLLYAGISHTHVIGDLTDFDPGDYLPLAGGIMTGAIDFSDPNEGPRWFDTVDTYVNMMSFDDSEGIIKIGGVSPNLGPVPIRVDSFALEVGVDGAGGSTFAMYSDGAMTMFPAITLDGNGFAFGDGSQEMNLNGSLARPQYNSNDLALLSDVPVSGTYDPQAIPRMQIGSGQAHVSVLNGLAFDVFPLPFLGYTPYFRVCARDFIRFIRGGATTLNYKVEIISWFDNGGGTPSMVYSSDPTSPLDLATDLDQNINQTHIFKIWIQDGNTGDETYVETYALLQDNQGIIPPPGP